MRMEYWRYEVALKEDLPGNNNIFIIFTEVKLSLDGVSDRYEIGLYNKNIEDVIA